MKFFELFVKNTGQRAFHCGGLFRTWDEADMAPGWQDRKLYDIRETNVNAVFLVVDGDNSTVGIFNTYEKAEAETKKDPDYEVRIQQVL